MVIPNKIQPDTSLGFESQNSTSLGLFSFMLDTSRTREDIDRSWAAIFVDIDLADIRDRNHHPHMNEN